MPTPRPRFSFSAKLGALAVLIVFITFGRITTHNFVDWDDDWLLRNPRLDPPTLSSVFGYFLPGNTDLNLYIPVTDVVWGGLAFIGRADFPDSGGWRLNPWVFHAASLMVHTASVLVVFSILRRLLRTDEKPRHRDLAAGLGALVFAVHPVQVETVAWACGMRDLLGGCFCFASIRFFLLFRDSSPHSARRWWGYAAAMACAILASLSKPAAVITPLIVLVIDVLLLGTTLRRSLATLWCWFALMLPIIQITRMVQPFVWAEPAPLLLRPLIAADAVAFYLWKLTVPLGLTFDYGRTPAVALSHGWPYFDWAIPVALAIALCWKGRRQKVLTTGAAVAVIGILPVMGFIPFMAQDYSTVSDHYLYPSMLGVSMAVAWAILRVERGWFYGVWFSLIALLAVQSCRVAEVWSDSRSLFTHEIEQNPRSWTAWSGLGTVFEREGDLAESEQCIRHSLAINDRNGFTHMGLATLLLREGRSAEALEEFRAMLRVYRMQRNFDRQLAIKAQTAIGALLLRDNRFDEAASAFEEALRLDPDQPEVRGLLLKATSAGSRPGG